MNAQAHIVALSGGKDSTAMALALKEREPHQYVYVCTPTGDELPDMLRHWERLGGLLGAPIVHLHAKKNLHELIEHWKALPNARMRWCTRMLKIQPFQAFLKQLSPPPIVYVGLRADEPEREGSIYSFPVEQRCPLREWGWDIHDVLRYLDEREIRIPARTDCARCYHQTLGEWWRLWHDHRDIYASAEAQEEATGRTFRSATRDTWPAALSGLRDRFERGHVPPRTVVADDLFLGGARRPTMCRVCTL